MTLAEMRRRSVILASRLQIARGKLNSALRIMDYERARACQLEVDSLLSEIVDLRHRLHGSLYGDHVAFAPLCSAATLCAPSLTGLAARQLTRVRLQNQRGGSGNRGA
jgi:hypothetical protein